MRIVSGGGNAVPSGTNLGADKFCCATVIAALFTGCASSLRCRRHCFHAFAGDDVAGLTFCALAITCATAAIVVHTEKIHAQSIVAVSVNVTFFFETDFTGCGGSTWILETQTIFTTIND